jgi:NitT/TauT family transport system ATP-binding protein
VFQRYSLFPVAHGRRKHRIRLEERGMRAAERERVVAEHIRLVHLEGFADRYPRELSGGMQQRVAIAQTLACQPAVLLMDEPFGALDAQTRRILQDELRRIWRRDTKTVLFVTHDVEEAVALGTRIVVMAARPGRIKEAVTRDFEVREGEELEANPAFVALKLRICAASRRKWTRRAAPAFRYEGAAGLDRHGLQRRPAADRARRMAGRFRASARCRNRCCRR